MRLHALRIHADGILIRSRTIDRLNDRVRELEEQLKHMQPVTNDSFEQEENIESVQRNPIVPTGSNLNKTFPTHLDPLAELGINKKYYNWDVVSSINTDFRQQTFGMSSSVYFIRQMTVYMKSEMRDSEFDFKPRFTFTSDIPRHEQSNKPAQKDLRNLQSLLDHSDLSKTAEENILSIFWKTSHITIAILDQESFEAHYDSLWNFARALRAPSALVDFVLALGMQHQMQSSVSTSGLEEPDDNVRPDKAGLWWQRRGQQLLADELEEPSIMTFQSHLLSVTWLSNAGLLNTAHGVMASAIRIGVILGLHLEPAENLRSEDREFRKHIWWYGYALEMKFAMDLGRPLAINCKQVTCSLPVEDTSLDDDNGFALLTTQFVKLILATRAIYITFYRYCADVLSKSGNDSIYKDTTILEECASFVASKAVYLQTWIQHVPNVLKAKRRNNSEPFSAEVPSPQVDTPIQIAETRSGTILEVYYHIMAMSLYRPFIVFPATRGSEAPNTKALAISCAKHAIAIVIIVQQICAGPSYLNSWVEIWQWLWIAALSLVGYILAYPADHMALEARKALDIAVIVLRQRSKQSAANNIHELMDMVDAVLHRLQDGGGVMHNENTLRTHQAETSTTAMTSDTNCKLPRWNDVSNEMPFNQDKTLTNDGVLTSLSFSPEGTHAFDDDLFDMLDIEYCESSGYTQT